jgi:hypothetical protein
MHGIVSMLKQRDTIQARLDSYFDIKLLIAQF